MRKPPEDIHPSRFHVARAGTRVVLGAALGLVVGVVVATLAPWQAAVLVGWDTMAAVVVAWMVGVVWPKGSAETKEWATREDDSRAAADAMILLASLGSLAAVAFGLVKASQADHAGA